MKDSYWAAGVCAENVKRRVESSLAFGLYEEGGQIGFARVVTDYAAFAYLTDVFVLEQHRGRGLGRWLLEVVLSHPDLRGIGRWLLSTEDAHELYRGHGFGGLERPDDLMEKRGP